MKRRTKIITKGLATSLIGVTILFSSMFYFAWRLAVRGEQAKLSQYASQIIGRHRELLQVAHRDLELANQFSGHPCSVEHIAYMRDLSMKSRAIKSMGYYENGVLRCTSWGQARQRKVWPKYDFITTQGIGIALSVTPLSTPNIQLMELCLGTYSVLMDSSLLIDVVVEPDIGLAILNQKNGVIDERNFIGPHLPKALWSAPGKGEDDNSIYATALDGSWMAVATKSRDSILTSYQQQQILLFPLVLLLSTALVGLVIWSSRRQLSLQGELEQAIRSREFLVFYQPIIDLRSRLCVGAEALIRWRQTGEK